MEIYGFILILVVRLKCIGKFKPIILKMTRNKAIIIYF